MATTGSARPRLKSLSRRLGSLTDRPPDALMLSSSAALTGHESPASVSLPRQSLSFSQPRRRERSANRQDVRSKNPLRSTAPSTPPSSVGGSTVRRATVKQSHAKSKLGSQPDNFFPGLGFGGARMTPEIYRQEFPGAIALESEVYCWYPAQHCWFSATVIHARLKLDLTTLPSGDFDTPRTELMSGDPARGDVTPASSNLTSVSCANIDERVLSSKSGGEWSGVKTKTILQNCLAARMSEDAVAITPFSWDRRQGEYDYYIHFHGEDRRQDMWVVSSLLRPSDFLFHPDEPFIYVAPGLDEIHRQMDVEYLRDHEENTKLKTIGKVVLGRYVVEAWYFSPYPQEFQNRDCIFLCEFCLDFFKHQCELRSHRNVCGLRHPPGDEVYRDAESQLSLFEVDGTLARTYCENLCFLSKLFLDHKTLRHPVYLFLFYVLTEYHDGGYQIVGYFSKEKYSRNNLSCIACLPQHQRKGYGQLLINLSYALSRKEGKRGTPERPLSDLGKATYVKYWAQAAIAALISPPLKNHEFVTLEEIAQQTSIEVADVAMALEAVGILKQWQPRGMPYLFLPDDIDAIAAWARPAFTNSLTPTFPAAQLAATRDAEKTETPRRLAPPVSKVPVRRSKRRRTNVAAGDDVAEFSGLPREFFGKRTKQGASPAALPKLSTETKPAGSSERRVPGIQPINLADVRWESYDLHLAPFEYAPIAN